MRDKITDGRDKSKGRHFNKEIADALKSYLSSSKGKRISIFCASGDREAFQFANEIKEHLESHGRKVEMNQTVFPGPVYGQEVKKKSDGSIEIVVGTKSLVAE